MTMKISFLIFLILALVSCTEFPDCQETRVDYARARFFSAADSLLTEVILDSVMVSGSDVVLYEQDTLSEVSLPLDPLADESTFFLFIEGETNTLVLNHSSKLEVLSPDCGPLQSFFDIEIGDHSFDSVALISPLADLRISNNVEIYR